MLSKGKKLRIEEYSGVRVDRSRRRFIGGTTHLVISGAVALGTGIAGYSLSNVYNQQRISELEEENRRLKEENALLKAQGNIGKLYLGSIFIGDGEFMYLDFRYPDGITYIVPLRLGAEFGKGITKLDSSGKIIDEKIEQLYRLVGIPTPEKPSTKVLFDVLSPTGERIARKELTIGYDFEKELSSSTGPRV